MSWPLAAFVILNSTFFGMYGHILQLMGHNEREEEKPQFFSTFAAGGLATIPTVLVACPMDVIKVTLQSQIDHFDMEKGRHFFSLPHAEGSNSSTSHV
jgi:hypothetical protein